MDFDILTNLLNNKMVSLEEELAKEEKKIREIGKFQEIIRRIKEDPFILYTPSGEGFIKLLGLDEKKMLSLRTIYDGYLKYGREAIPQISVVEENTEGIKKDLESKIFFLSDVVAKHQGNVLVFEGYRKLNEEVSSEDSYISQIDTLVDLLNTSELSIEERVRILSLVNARNVIIQTKKKEEVLKESLVESEKESNYATAISAMRNELENNYGEDSLKHLEVVSNLLNNCSSSLEVEEILSGWDYSLGISYSKIIDGVIMLKNIEILELKETFGEEDVDAKEEINSINEQIAVLTSYKDSIEMDREAVVVDTTSNMNEYEKAIYEYNPDPLSYPNRVFFLNNAVGRDIDSIRDKETLQDLFVLMENLKKGNVQPKTLSDTSAKEIKPFKRGRQARIRYDVLDDNVCVIVQIIERKSDKCRGEQQTLKLRQKEVPALEERMKDPEFVSELVNVTKVHSEKLLSLITKSSTNKVGGVS